MYSRALSLAVALIGVFGLSSLQGPKASNSLAVIENSYTVLGTWACYYDPNLGYSPCSGAFSDTVFFIPRFRPEDGKLRAISFTVLMNGSQSVGAEFLGPTEGYFHTEFLGRLTYPHPAGLPWSLPLEARDVQSSPFVITSPFDGIVDFGGPSGASAGFSGQDVEICWYRSAFFNMGPYVQAAGQPQSYLQAQLEVGATLDGFVQGPAAAFSFAQQSSYTGSCTAIVRYHYEPH